MGNNTSGELHLPDLIAELDQQVACQARTVSVSAHDPYKVVVQLGDAANIIKNVRVPDRGFRCVYLTVGAHVFTASLDKHVWRFSAAIPVLKLHTPCELTILSNQDDLAHVEIEYDAYCDMPEALRARCLAHPIIAGGEMYADGCVY